MDAEDLKRRTKAFGLRAVRLAESLPRTRSGNVFANQLMRSATSVGANYRAACRPRSSAEFIAKLGNVEEEADESCYWMELIIDSGMKRPSLVQALHDEGDELLRIVIQSIRTAGQGNTKIRNPKSAIRNR